MNSKNQVYLLENTLKMAQQIASFMLDDDTLANGTRKEIEELKNKIRSIRVDLGNLQL